MILDAGICTIHRVDGTERSAKSPTAGLPQVYRDWCGGLNHESGSSGVRTAKVRIHDADVQQHDIAEYAGKNWIVTRVYHGTDDETGQSVADLTMESGDRLFFRATLIATEKPDPPVNERGFANPPVETARGAWGMIEEITHIEYASENARGIRAGIKLSVYAVEYRGEMLVEIDGKRYTVEQTRETGGALITLTLDNAAKGGAAGGKV